MRLVLRLWVGIWRFRGDGDDDGFAVIGTISLDGGPEGVLEEFGDDVFEMHGDEGKCRVGLAVDYPLGSHTVFQFADVGYKAAAAFDG